MCDLFQNLYLIPETCIWYVQCILKLEEQIDDYTDSVSFILE
jgi:hypothetical protein